jgi:hypothetical protein
MRDEIPCELESVHSEFLRPAVFHFDFVDLAPEGATHPEAVSARRQAGGHAQAVPLWPDAEDILRCGHIHPGRRAGQP